MRASRSAAHIEPAGAPEGRGSATAKATARGTRFRRENTADCSWCRVATKMIEKEHEKNQSSLPSPVSPVVSQYHRAAKRSELNRQQRRCQPGGNRRPIVVCKVLHTLRSTGPGTSAAVCGGMLMVGRLSKPPRRSRPTPAQMHGQSRYGPCMAIVTAARNAARRRTDARPNCG